MAYAILRAEKITSHTSATSRTQHNYRTQETPNADSDQFSRNQELINHDKHNYWDLAAERIAELELTRLRKDAVRCVELLLTGSPEAFERDANGRANDMQDSPWLKDNLHFLQQRFGERNVIGCVLHQDEVTPHIHAVVVPVTEDGRLSARDVFSPTRLRQLQTEYAKSMAPYGMERGVEYSTAIHEDVRRHHGAQRTTKQQLAEVATPLEYKPFQIADVKFKDLTNPQAYLRREQDRMNAHLAEQVAAVNAKLVEVATIAAANTLERERAKVLEQRLANNQKQHGKRFDDLSRTQRELGEKNHALSKLHTRFDHVVMQAAQGEPLPQALSDWAAKTRAESLQRAERVAATVLRHPITNAQQLMAGLKSQGFAVYKPDAEQLTVRDEKTQVRFPLSELRPNGQDLGDAINQAIERTKQEDEQARRRELAQQPGVMRAAITARNDEQAGRIQAALEQSGANVWQVQALADKRVEILVSYHFDWKTIEGISQVLDKAKRTADVRLEESYAHWQKRTGSVKALERERGARGRSEQDLER